MSKTCVKTNGFISEEVTTNQVNSAQEIESEVKMEPFEEVEIKEEELPSWVLNSVGLESINPHSENFEKKSTTKIKRDNLNKDETEFTNPTNLGQRMAYTLEKRVRSANFTNEEKIKILINIKKFKHIIESHKTNKVSYRDKEECWQRIADICNVTSFPGAVKRTAETIKRFYENQKKLVRKQIAKEKLELKKTEAESCELPRSIINDPVYSLTLSLMDKNAMETVKNKCDDDQRHFIHSSSSSSEHCDFQEETEVANQMTTKETERKNSKTPLKLWKDQTISAVNLISNDDDDDNLSRDYDINIVNSDCAAEDFNESTKVTIKPYEAQKTGYVNNGNSRKRKFTNMQRRKSTLNFSSRAITKLYKEMAEMKLNLASLQVALMEPQKLHEEKKRQHELRLWTEQEEIIKIQKQAALLDVEIKKLQLQKLKFS